MNLEKWRTELEAAINGTYSDWVRDELPQLNAALAILERACAEARAEARAEAIEEAATMIQGASGGVFLLDSGKPINLNLQPLADGVRALAAKEPKP